MFYKTQKLKVCDRNKDVLNNFIADFIEKNILIEKILLKDKL